MDYTPEQLREWADTIESGNWQIGGGMVAIAYRAHASVLEELARLKAPVKKEEVDELVGALRIAYSYDVTQDTSTVREVELVHKAASILERISAQLAEARDTTVPGSAAAFSRLEQQLSQREEEIRALEGHAEAMAVQLTAMLDLFNGYQGRGFTDERAALSDYRAAYPKE